MQDLYYSRTDRGSAIIARQDPVIYEGGSYADALSAEQLAAYDREGFLQLDNVFSNEEVQTLLEETQRMASDPAITCLPEAITEPGSNAV